VAEPPVGPAGGGEGGEPSPRDRRLADGRPGAAAGGARRPGVSRLLGLDRSGPPPRATLRGEPLRPWTAPNAIGFVRLALIPVFLVVALSSEDGTGALPATLFAVIGFGDYADGITARLTGQYSRLGSLMDPVTDRLLVLSGVIVAWDFELLPRWALTLLALRELAMVGLARYGLAHGLELSINWPGRLAVAPVMGSFFFAMVGLGTLAEVMLYAGLALALAASALYVASGLRQLRASTGSREGARPSP
jgi:cardiolipin synthase